MGFVESAPAECVQFHYEPHLQESVLMEKAGSRNNVRHWAGKKTGLKSVFILFQWNCRGVILLCIHMKPSRTGLCNVFRLWALPKCVEKHFRDFWVVIWWCFSSAPEEQLDSRKTQFCSRWWYLDSTFFHWVQTHKQGIFFLKEKSTSSVFSKCFLLHTCACFPNIFFLPLGSRLEWEGS